METEENYNFNKKEIDLIKNAIEHFLNCMTAEDRQKYDKPFEVIINKLNLN